MKKLLALLLTLVMCLSLAACGGSGTDTSGTDTSSGETGEDSGDSSYRVAMICDSSISDGGWGMSCYNAMVDAAAERGWATLRSVLCDTMMLTRLSIVLLVEAQSCLPLSSGSML